MKPRKTPSGKWRLQIYDYTDEQGKQHKKSFTHSDKKELLRIVAEYQIKKEQIAENRITLGEGCDRYIESHKAVLSPATIHGYKGCQKRLSDYHTQLINNLDIQAIVNDLSSKYSSKTVRNTYGFLKAVCSAYSNNDSTAKLPPKIKKDIYIPTDDDIKTLLDFTKENETNMYRAVLLASVGCMRRGEIAALNASDIVNGVIHINKSMVRNEQGIWIVKSPKTYESDRKIKAPTVLLNALPTSGSCVDMNPQAITNRFEHILRRCKLEHFSFHTLRHYCASRQIYANIPLKEIQAYGGWSNSKTLDEIYLHCLSQMKTEIDDKRNEIFNRFL